MAPLTPARGAAPRGACACAARPPGRVRDPMALPPGRGRGRVTALLGDGMGVSLQEREGRAHPTAAA